MSLRCFKWTPNFLVVRMKWILSHLLCASLKKSITHIYVRAGCDVATISGTKAVSAWHSIIKTQVCVCVCVAASLIGAVLLAPSLQKRLQSFLAKLPPAIARTCAGYWDCTIAKCPRGGGGGLGVTVWMMPTDISLDSHCGVAAGSNQAGTESLKRLPQE